MKRRIVSLALSICMIVTMLPLQAFASGTGNQLVFLPVVADDTVDVGSGMALLSDEKTPVYASTGSFSAELPEMQLPQAVTTGSEGARVQALDEQGTVVGQTTGFALYKEAESISSCRLFFLDTLRAGEYALQLVFGDVEAISAVELDYCLTVVDAPVITGGWLSLSAGTTASTLALYIDGYRGDPSIYTFSLLDAESGDPIGCTGVHTDTDEYSDGSVRLSFALLPKTALTSGTQYYLAIGVSTGSLYTSADRISSCAYERDAAIAVLDIAEDDTAVGGLKITVGGVKEAETYTVTAALDYDGDHLLYQGTLQPEMQDGNGVFSFVLTYNELALPLSAYSYIYISIRDENGSSDSSSFRPNSSSTVYQSTELSLTVVGETEYAFVLTGRNLLLDLYEQTEPLQFSLKHYDKTTGKWVQASVSCSVTRKHTYAQDGAAYFEFSGTLTTSSALDTDIYYRLYQ